MVIHLLLWCLQGTDSKPCCHKSEVNKFIYMATNLRNAQQLLAFIDTEDIVSNNVFNWLYSRISLQLWISHPWISIFSASLDNQQPVSTAGFLTGKVFLFGCCEPLRSFRYIDSLSHLHLEIITIYMSTSIFMYTCHMFAGSFQNQGSILKKKYIYIYYTSIFNVHTKRYHFLFWVRFFQYTSRTFHEFSPWLAQARANGTMGRWSHGTLHAALWHRQGGFRRQKWQLKIDVEMELGGAFKYFLFSPLFGEGFHFD